MDVMDPLLQRLNNLAPIRKASVHWKRVGKGAGVLRNVSYIGLAGNNLLESFRAKDEWRAVANLNKGEEDARDVEIDAFDANMQRALQQLIIKGHADDSLVDSTMHYLSTILRYVSLMACKCNP